MTDPRSPRVDGWRARATPIRCAFLAVVTDHTRASQVLASWDFDDPAGSAQRFAEAAAGEPDPAHRLTLLTQLARAQGLGGDLAAGDATLDDLGDPADLPPEPAVRALLERGRLRNTGGDPAAAEPLFTAAYELAVGAGLAGLAADAAHMLAIVLPPERHPEWADRGLAAAAGSDDPLARRMVGVLLNNLGWTYADQGDWVQALEVFDRALAVRIDQGDRVAIHVARWARARALRALGRPDEALDVLRELAASPEGADDRYVAEEIAENQRVIEGG